MSFQGKTVAKVTRAENYNQRTQPEQVSEKIVKPLLNPCGARWP